MLWCGHNRVITIIKAKGGKQGRVRVKPDTIQKLQAYAQEHGIAADSPLFQNKEGNAYSQRWVRKIVGKYGR